MKKGYQVILAITLGFLFLVAGIFVGRFTKRGTLSVESSQISTTDPDSNSTSDALSTGKINVNKADVDELTLLPGIGETLAQRIVAYRTMNGDFQAIEDLMNVEGIGEVKFSQISNYITI